MKEKNKKVPEIGIGVLVIKDNKVLYGKRKTAPEIGSWCFPGGHLEFNETIEDCAKREVMEETGISIKNIQLGPVTNNIFNGEKIHSVTIFVIAEHDSGEVKVMEPEASEGWGWFSWENPPSPLFLPNRILRQQGFNPFDYK